MSCKRIIPALLAAFAAAGAIGAPQSATVCTKNVEDTYAEVLEKAREFVSTTCKGESCMSSLSRAEASIYSTLKAFGCSNSFTQEFETQLAQKKEAELEAQQEREAAQKAAQARKQEDLERQRVAAQIAAEREEAEREAFEESMAKKCGAYPLDVKLGMSERLLKLGCAGNAVLALERADGLRVYLTAYEQVAVVGGKVAMRVAR